MTETIVLGGGCFWCTEAVYRRVKGVSSVTPGYAGGSVPNPDYETVCSGRTGHAEVVKVEYDPKLVSLDKILKIFFAAHDPTTINRQGADTGTQYRSIILYTDKKQLPVIEKLKPDNAVTEVKPLDNFYPAEDYHVEYYENNREAPYCQLVIDPKIKKIANLL